MIDLWGKNSRDEFIECEYWSVDDNIYSNNDRIIYQNRPTGFFRAKEVNSFVEENQVVGQAFLTKQHNVTLETHDNVSDLKNNDLVKFENLVYRVDSIQKTSVKKQKMFMDKDYSASYFISLRR